MFTLLFKLCIFVRPEAHRICPPSTKVRAPLLYMPKNCSTPAICHVHVLVRTMYLGNVHGCMGALPGALPVALPVHGAETQWPPCPWCWNAVASLSMVLKRVSRILWGLHIIIIAVDCLLPEGCGARRLDKRLGWDYVTYCEQLSETRCFFVFFFNCFCWCKRIFFSFLPLFN